MHCIVQVVFHILRIAILPRLSSQSNKIGNAHPPGQQRQQPEVNQERRGRGAGYSVPNGSRSALLDSVLVDQLKLLALRVLPHAAQHSVTGTAKGSPGDGFTTTGLAYGQYVDIPAATMIITTTMHHRNRGTPRHHRVLQIAAGEGVTLVQACHAYSCSAFLRVSIAHRIAPTKLTTAIVSFGELEGKATR